jgi:catechol 2,3-dioxygenase-like lactoylglutathione lyase family enzyme
MTNDLPAPEQGLVLTHFLTVRDVARSRDFYADIFGGRVVLQENPGHRQGRQQLDHHEPQAAARPLINPTSSWRRGSLAIRSRPS